MRLMAGSPWDRGMLVCAQAEYRARPPWQECIRTTHARRSRPALRLRRKTAKNRQLYDAKLAELLRQLLGVLVKLPALRPGCQSLNEGSESGDDRS